MLKIPNVSFTLSADEETLNILNAMQEYHNKTCIRFRPYVQSDKNWIEIKQDYSGCWSSVGMKVKHLLSISATSILE